jgi:hypothetical protein
LSGVSLLALRIQGPAVLAPLDADDFAYAVVSAAALAALLLAFGRSRASRRQAWALRWSAAPQASGRA